MNDDEQTYDVWAKAKQVKSWIKLRSGLSKAAATREMNDRRGRLQNSKWERDTTIIIRPSGDEPPA